MTQDPSNIRFNVNVARQRWRLLGKALIQKKRHNDIVRDGNTGDVSVRRFSAYGLLSSKQLLPLASDGEDQDSLWFQYTCPSYPGFCVCIRHLRKQFSPEDLIGFNNTGNVCVWPSEEILAHHCLKNTALFREKTVCELGGGMTCLAGMAVAATSDASRVILTDGNDLSCDNIRAIVKKNKARFSRSEVTVRNLRWNEASSFSDLGQCVDVILCADCLFFDQYRSDLVDTIHSIMTADGVAIIFAPRRGHTLEKFCQEAKTKFHLTLEDNYDPAVWHVYQEAKTKGREVFDEDIHYPLKIALHRKVATEHSLHNGTNGNGLCEGT